MDYQQPNNPKGALPKEKELDNKGGNGASEGKKKNPKSLRKKILIIAIVLLIIFVGGAFTVEFTSQSSFCKTCHVMQDFYQSWEQSSHYLTDGEEVSYHKTAECIDCHGKPGFIGTVETKIDGMRQLWVNITDKPDPDMIKADPAVVQVQCIKCHQSKPRTDLEQAAADKDPHSQAHFNEMTCMSCHEGLVHKGTSVDRERETCRRCHLDAMDL